MTSRRAFAAILILGCALMMPGASALAATPSVPDGGGRLLLEGGWAVPLGDLQDGLDATPTGVGARPGFELGMRWRFPLTPSWSVAPSFHFLGYGDATGLGSDGESSLSPTSLRYGLELMLKSPRHGSRLFIALAPGVVHNHLKGPGKDHLTLVDATSTVLGLSARAGIDLGGLEISAVYHVNRFRSFGFFFTGTEKTYNWDTVVLRFGWRLP